MAVEGTRIDAIKGEILSGAASKSTLDALQSLLEPETISRQPTKKDQSTNVKSTNTKTSVPPNGRRAAVQSRSQPAASATAKLLSPREQYALATETANICLKSLTDSLKQ